MAGAGKKVAVVEQSAGMYGGTCINVGCIPSKSLIKSAELSEVQKGGFEEKAARYRAAVRKKNQLTGMLRQKNFHKLNDNAAIDVINGKAEFADNHRIRIIKTDEEEIITGEQIFINTGSRPFFPPIPGLKESSFCYTSETLMDLEILPEHLIIIGGGYIGMEFASMYANFGSQVTVIQDGDVFLPREDEEIAAAVLESLRERNIRVILSGKTEEIKDDKTNAVVAVNTENGREMLKADAILIAAGRRPNTSELNLEAAGVELDERNAVKTDARKRTSVPNIWAMGDVTGGLQFTYISLDDFRIVKSQILGDKSRTGENRGTVPYSVFLDPPFSRAGLTEREALEQGYSILVKRLPAAAIPKAQVLSKPRGLLKVILDEKTGYILGAHLFCAQSHEIINLIKLAIDAKIPYTVLRDGIYTHPTMAEAFNDLFA